MIVKILSYNIHKGFDWKNQNYFLQEMKQFLSESKADIVCLQEVVGKNSKYKDQGLIDSQFEFLADQLWPHYSYAQNAVYDHGHHGNLILSKFPILEFENIDLSTNAFEKRGLLVCKIAIPNGQLKEKTLFVACSHLNLLHAGRLKQYQQIKTQIQLKDKQNIPFIIAGDFNDWNKKSLDIFEHELKMMEVYKTVTGNYAKTFPAFYPLLCLDRIYVKNANIKEALILKPKLAHTPRDYFSDHLALFCEVELHGT
jgi:endonuclease/exonuclease/phosphatase family metal-dependent hydrolase